MPRSVHRLIRPLVVALAAVLVGPVLTVTPASAAVLFTCTGIDGGTFLLSPGLSHTQTAQSAFQNDVTLGFSLPCNNGEKGFFRIGRNFTGLTDVTTYPPRPLGCPVAWGGAGPDYPDKMPILRGTTDPSFDVHWYSDDTSSTGTTKVKQGSTSTRWRVIFTITAGKYVAPAGLRTQIKFEATIDKLRGNEPKPTCRDDSNPWPGVRLLPLSTVVVQQH
jgi:hypothetical protein